MPDHIPADIRRFFRMMSLSEKLRFKALIKLPDVQRIVRASRKQEAVNAYVEMVHANVATRETEKESNVPRGTSADGLEAFHQLTS